MTNEIDLNDPKWITDLSDTEDFQPVTPSPVEAMPRDYAQFWRGAGWYGAVQFADGIHLFLVQSHPDPHGEVDDAGYGTVYDRAHQMEVGTPTYYIGVE